MKISIICSSRRPRLWKKFHSQLHSDKVDYEILFIGPFKPSFILPKNCKFIHTIVKPSQCSEIGFREASGEYLLGPLGDDLISKKNKIVEDLVKFINQQKDDLFLLSTQVVSYGETLVKPSIEFNNLTIPHSPVFSKRIYNLVGGIDKNFIAVMYEVDLYLRMMQIGCKVYHSEISFFEIERSILEPTLYGDYSKADKELFNNLWRTNNCFNFKTKRLVNNFSSKNIIVESQGPSGKWKYKSIILFYIMQSNFKNKILKLLRLDFPIFVRFYTKNKNNLVIKSLGKLIKKIFY